MIRVWECWVKRGNEGWRPMSKARRKRPLPERYAMRRLSNRKSKTRFGGDITIY